MNTSELYEWNNTDEMEPEIESGKPKWYKLWVDKYFDAIDIENLDEDLTPEEKEILFREVGKAFINSLFYFMQHDEESHSFYKPHTRDGKIIYNALKRDIDQSFRDYEKRVIDGRKGGRPPKKTDN